MLYRVDMSKMVVTQEKETEYQGLGGRLLSKNILRQELAVTADVWKDNKIVLATGLLAGMQPIYAGRLSLCMKSPVLGEVKENNTGGMLADQLGRMNTRAIIIEGLPSVKSTYILYISPKKAEIQVMPTLQNLDFQVTADFLSAHFGKQIAVGCIDAAGEKQLTEGMFGITNIKGKVVHFAGRSQSGVAAVFASKGIKAIVVDAEGEIPVAVDQLAFQTASAYILSLLNQGEGMSQQRLKEGACLACGNLSCAKWSHVEPGHTEHRYMFWKSAENGFIDSMGVCLFAVKTLQQDKTGLEKLAMMCNARYGWNKTLAEYLSLAEN
ncbi:Aldehyde ferredoxin oxidoreductase, N-terminal domain [Propionispira arboris]|uniref:Aldehyde ferredoxin oxidoreductase, N-terminal domain n=1 Tax=Propionispira arboris TaxID=84035 RepID=A0A1H6XMS5_9FIRM|nr:aldehyde ferredoxin oxidoreductase N-terminal domain-containing protein [Propionispira arboris]SEJ30381.1 Aldehyde ferredoxin oxidoreductase, N-terminal domain [Propionispira arboris]